MTSIFNYAFGDGEAAGIATISGDAGGFSYISEPLDKIELMSTLGAVIREEDFTDAEKAELLADAEAQIERLHTEHVARFTDESRA